MVGFEWLSPVRVVVITLAFILFFHILLVVLGLRSSKILATTLAVVTMIFLLTLSSLYTKFYTQEVMKVEPQWEINRSFLNRNLP